MKKEHLGALALSAILLVASTAGPASAGVSGSKSVSGTAVYLTDYIDRGCSPDNGSVNTADNVLDDPGGYAGVWVKSADLKRDPGAFGLAYVLYDKGNNVVDSGTLINWFLTCGDVFRLFYLSEGYPTVGGSLTLKVTYASNDKTFANDSARFMQ